MTKFEDWIAEAENLARSKKNSALPLNRRARTASPTQGGTAPKVTKYTRGTITTIGNLEVTL